MRFPGEPRSEGGCPAAASIDPMCRIRLIMIVPFMHLRFHRGMSEESEFARSLKADIQKGQAVTAAAANRLEDLIALQRLPPFPKDRFLPWTRSALKPSTVLLLLQEIELHQHECILELGSGISTLYISLILQGTGRRLISIDNDADWQGIVRKQAESLGLSLETTTFVHAPFKPFSSPKHSGD